MVDLPNRENFEAELARRLSREFASVRRLIVELLGDPPDYNKVTIQTWQQIQERLTGAILPELEAAFVAQVEAMADDVGYGFDMDIVNTQAQAWARGYAFDLVRGVNDTSRRRLQTIVRNHFDRGVTIGDTRNEISKLFGPVRAQMIAQTEVTRAATQGELQAQRQLVEQGVRLRTIHKTNVDDRVCPICGPRHNQEITDGRYPPLHVGCRCWVSTEVIPLDEVDAATPVNVTPSTPPGQASGERRLSLDGFIDDDPASVSNINDINTLTEYMFSGGPRSQLMWDMQARYGPTRTESVIDGFNDDGTVKINQGALRQYIQSYVRETRSNEWSRDYFQRSLANDIFNASGERVSPQEAERIYNADEARRADTMMILARVSKLRLTEPQRRRLELARNGQYSDMTFEEVGELGTVMNALERARQARSRTSATERARLKEDWNRTMGLGEYLDERVQQQMQRNEAVWQQYTASGPGSML